MKEIFEFVSYKKYLNEWLLTRPQAGRGWRSRLAEAIGTQAGFITQVLSGNAHFSLEQGLAASQLLAQTAEEQSFFILLIQYERAGTPDLQGFFRGQIQRVRQERLELSKRLKLQKAPDEAHQAIYFRTWLPAAIHVMLLGDQWRTKEAIAEYLGVPLLQVIETVDFLVKSGLVEPHKDGYRTGPVLLHLGKESPHLLRHHLNWNFKAIQAIEADHKKDLHFSSVMTLTAEDAQRIRALLTTVIEEANKIAADSAAEKVYATALNLFELKKS